MGGVERFEIRRLVLGVDVLGGSERMSRDSELRCYYLGRGLSTGRYSSGCLVGIMVPAFGYRRSGFDDECLLLSPDYWASETYQFGPPIGVFR